GNWADTQKKNKIADLLFSTDTTSDGNPKGIGLSLWRFNIGSGSYEQGAESDIRDEWRREECFLNEDGTYNWNKQKGQQWFLTEAKRRGVQYTLGFSLTPPTFMSQNGKAYNSTNLPNLNITAGKLDDYADFMAEVSSHFKFDYLSPINEPQWFWGKDRISQEGTQATNTEIANLVRLLSPKLLAKGSDSKIVVGEAGQWDFLYGRNEDGRGDQINQFFAKSSPNFIANLPNVKHTISGHSYFTTCPDNNMINIRKQIADKVNEVDKLDVWQTEFGILGNICDKYKGGPRNTGIDYGLYVASVIHHDLTVANVTSWQWWLAVSPYDYSDALVYINDPQGKINVKGSKEDGQVLDSKQLWVFGNFARFIRPGMKRIDASVEGIKDPVVAASSLMVSAYKDEAQKKIVFVIINPEKENKNIQLLDDSGALKLLGNTLNVYTTDSKSGLKKSMVKAGNINVSSQSVITLVGTYL
ncbi:MAG: glycoside hydrolase, partial [Sphingobacteriaceae bacterium]